MLNLIPVTLVLETITPLSLILTLRTKLSNY